LPTMRLFTFVLVVVMVGCMASDHSVVDQTRSHISRPAQMDQFLFGVCYYPEQWSSGLWRQDARRMRECGVNTVRMAEFAWDRIEPREGEFDFAWLDEVIDILGAEGIHTILGTPTATPPKWLTHKYPDVLSVDEYGRRADDQSRRSYCYNSPRYRVLCRRIVEAMAHHFENNKYIIGWQIDNEMNNENKACFCDNCRRSFEGWLKGKYGTLAELNARWGTAFWSQTYTDWDQVGLPAPTPAYHNPGLILDHRRFVSDAATSFLEAQVAIIRQHCPGDFITHNGLFDGINYYRFAQNLDLYAQDNYPTFLEQPRFPTAALLTACRSFNGRMMIMEQLTGSAGQTYLLRTPAPGEMKFWSMQAIAHGADSVLHFRWRSALRGAEQYWAGVLDQDNIPRARFDEFKEEGREIEKLGKEILGSVIRSDVAIINDYEAQWAYDHQYFTDEVNAKSGVHMREDLIEIFQAISEQGYNVDFISPVADFAKYKLIFAPRLLMADAALAERIKRFVASGGIFVTGAHTAVKDRDNAVTGLTPPGLLADSFGVNVENFQCYQPKSSEKNDVRFDDGSKVSVFVFADLLKPSTQEGTKVVATWDRDFFSSRPACTEHVVKTGKAVYYGSFLNHDSARYLLGRYEGELNLTPLLPNLPTGVEVTRRTKGEIDYYFLLNHGRQDATIDLGTGFIDVLGQRDTPPKLVLGSQKYIVLQRRR
jgi:beta-galactosidase